MKLVQSKDETSHRKTDPQYTEIKNEIEDIHEELLGLGTMDDMMVKKEKSSLFKKALTQ